MSRSDPRSLPSGGTSRARACRSPAVPPVLVCFCLGTCLLLAASAGCRKRHESGAPDGPGTLALSPSGPEIQVRLALAPELELLLPGRVRVSRAEGGEVVLEGEAPRDASGATRVRRVADVDSVVGAAGGTSATSATSGAVGVALGEIVVSGGIEIAVLDAAGLGSGGPSSGVPGSGGVGTAPSTPERRLADFLGAVLAGRGGRPEARRFRGRLVVLPRGDALELSSRLTLEEYLAGVVGAEMPASAYPLEALKAQAVAARTYALHAILDAGVRGRRPVFGGDEGFQVYGGMGWEHPRSTRAVRETSGEVLAYRGQVFRAYFHAACGGRTVPVEQVFLDPPMEPLAGVACSECEGPWEATYASEEIALALRGWLEERGVRLGDVTGVEVSETWPEGRARWVRVRHSRGSFEITANRFRALTRSIDGGGLGSTGFRVEAARGAWVFRGAGRGHGVGLCQVGASKRGKAEGYREILRRYYPGSSMATAY